MTRARTSSRLRSKETARSTAWTWNSEWVLGSLLALITLIAYQRIWQCGYIWDDDAYVTGNQLLRDWHGLWRVWFDLLATPQYYPLVHTTFWVEYHLWGLNPLGFHLTNVSLHILAAILLWRVLVLLRVPGAWLAAAMFAVHPVEVESVAWITERKNVLSAVFYFAAALAYLRFLARTEAEGANRRGWLCYFGSLFSFVLALLSKTVACSLPAALLLVRWWKTGRLRRNDVVALLPFFAFGLWFGGLTAWLERHHVLAEGAEWSLTFPQRFLIAGRAICFYAAKLAWPEKLTFIYPRWDVSASAAWQWIFPAAVAALIVTLWYARTRIGRGPLVAVLFFVGTLFPALGFINVYPFRYSFVADHFQYLASVGLIALVAVGLSRLPRIGPALVLALLVFLTGKQAGIYRGLDTLWGDTLNKNPGSWMVQDNFGAVLVSQGRVVEALDHFRKALQSNPNNVVTHNDLGMALLRVGNVEESFVHLRRALEINPDYAAAHFNLANSLLQLGQVDEAVFHLQKGLAIDPHDAEAEKNMAWVLATCPDERMRDGARAVAFAESANQTEPDDPIIGATLAAAYAETGRFSDAVRTAENALRLATLSGNSLLADGLRQHLALYRAGRPVRDVRQPTATGGR